MNLNPMDVLLGANILASRRNAKAKVAQTQANLNAAMRAAQATNDWQEVDRLAALQDKLDVIKASM